MSRHAFFALACAAGLMTAAHAQTPQRAQAGPGEQTYKSTTLSSEAYEPKTTLDDLGAPSPSCQIKIGDAWSETPAATLEDCAALLDQKSPTDPKPMTTAYWNNLYLSADGKNIYQASKEASEWTVLRPRGRH
jgi:hypothetical protein